MEVKFSALIFIVKFWKVDSVKYTVKLVILKGNIFKTQIYFVDLIYNHKLHFINFLLLSLYLYFYFLSLLPLSLFFYPYFYCAVKWEGRNAWHFFPNGSTKEFFGTIYAIANSMPSFMAYFLNIAITKPYCWHRFCNKQNKDQNLNFAKILA